MIGMLPTFLKLPGSPKLWSWLIGEADRVRDDIHVALAKVADDSQQLPALESSHFVWIDQPEIMVTAVKMVIDRAKGERINQLPDFRC